MSTYRVWYFSEGRRMRFYSVATPKEGYDLIERMTARDLKDPGVTANAFGLEFLDPDTEEWETWYDKDDNDVLAAFEQKDA